MSNSKEDALHAAMLAKFVGGQLGQIDSMTNDRSLRANRININEFVSRAVNNQPTGGALPPTPPGFAPPPSEDIIRRMVPEPQPRIYSDVVAAPQTAQSVTYDFSKIESYLENIDKNIQLLISTIKNG
jgi:hypothetical protein